jgi:alanine racemase
VRADRGKVHARPFPISSDGSPALNTTSRRTVLKTAALAAFGSPGLASAATAAMSAPPGRSTPSVAAVGDRVEPWIEIDATAFRSNITAIAARTGNKPVCAVLKCNAYGMDAAVVAPLLDPLPQLWGYAVAKAAEAHAIRDSGARKPVLMLCDFATGDAIDLARREVALCTYSTEARPRLRELAKRLGRRVVIHVKVDAGLGRLGIPLAQADQWIADLVADDCVTIEGIFCSLVEVPERARPHLAHFTDLVQRLRARRIQVGKAHAAASFGIAHMPEAALDMVRPGLMCHGNYPDGPIDRSLGLTVAHRLRGRVMRVSRLDAGDGVGYYQRYIASVPTWTASVMCGCSDGYNFRPLKGAKLLIEGASYPVIALTANTTVADLGSGDAPPLREGAIATLVGPEEGVRPNDLAERTDDSAYNQIKYSATLPKFIAST